MRWVVAERVLNDRRHATVQPQMFGTGLLTVAYTIDRYDELTFDECWTYPSVAAAVAALNAWEGWDPPDGWIRHKPSNRRRPDGDPAREYIRP